MVNTNAKTKRNNYTPNTRNKSKRLFLRWHGMSIFILLESHFNNTFVHRRFFIASFVCKHIESLTHNKRVSLIICVFFWEGNQSQPFFHNLGLYLHTFDMNELRLYRSCDTPYEYFLAKYLQTMQQYSITNCLRCFPFFKIHSKNLMHFLINFEIEMVLNLELHQQLI